MSDPLYLAKSEDGYPVLLPQMANRHGLITGATGTGKTVTLQSIAERLSYAGVPVFMADVKGDLSGAGAAGVVSPKLQKRIEELGLGGFLPYANRVAFWDVFGQGGIPVRATISDMGPLLLGRLLNLNDTQAGVLQLVFKIADDNGLLCSISRTCGICIVISPLIALMKDQVENLVKRGIKATAIYSGMTKREIDIAIDNCVYGDFKFLYLSPERIETEIFKARIPKMNVNLFAIDESHCISQWGYDFRPSYLNIAQLRELKPEVPFLALTATATTDVVKDIQQKLGFKKENVLQKSFERKNIAYVVIYEEDKLKRLLKILSKIKGTSR